MDVCQRISNPQRSWILHIVGHKTEMFTKYLIIPCATISFKKKSSLLIGDVFSILTRSLLQSKDILQEKDNSLIIKDYHPSHHLLTTLLTYKGFQHTIVSHTTCCRKSFYSQPVRLNNQPTGSWMRGRYFVLIIHRKNCLSMLILNCVV